MFPIVKISICVLTQVVGIIVFIIFYKLAHFSSSSRTHLYIVYNYMIGVVLFVVINNDSF
ncbi:MAG: hypothetical protein Pg6B_01450 [Candidatus Azobacteroides pseudotrichonymphae]|nr:MAG: hypothetical protein Pg6B_01450 [Candidatus Azobacteroides pseudotrichonymphae]